GLPDEAIHRRARLRARQSASDPEVTASGPIPSTHLEALLIHRMSPRHLFCPLIPAALFAFAALLAPEAGAVGTRTFQLDALDDFKGGDFTGTSVASNGNLRAGLALGSTPVTDAQSVWSSVVLGDGTVLLGTGNDGKVFKVANGQVSVAATTGQMAAS